MTGNRILLCIFCLGFAGFAGFAGLAGAQTKFSGTLDCSKSNPRDRAPAGERAGHSLILEQLSFFRPCYHYISLRHLLDEVFRLTD